MIAVDAVDLPSLVVGILTGGAATSIGFALGCAIRRQDQVIADLLAQEES